MKAKKLTALLITLLLFFPAIAQDDSESASELSNTHQASCLLKITANPQILPMNSQIMYYLLTSSAVAGKASRRVLDVPFDEISDSISIEILPSGQDNIPGIRGGMMRGMGGGGMGGGMGGGSGGGFGGGMGGGMMGDMTSEEIVISSEPEEESPESKYITTVSKVYTTGRGSAGSSGTSRRPAASRSTASSTTSRRTPAARPTTAGTTHERTAVFHLQINLSQELKPAALEFQKAIINNLRESLIYSYVVQKRQLEDEQRRAHEQLLKAEQQLQQVMGIDAAANTETQHQLEEKVDLSMLTPDTTFADALDILKDSVEPPLQINVDWPDLFDSGDIEQTTTINMEGLRDVRLAKALEFLLDSVSGGYVDLGYQIDDGIIKIATEMELSSSQPASAQMLRQDISLDYLLEQKQRLFDNKQSYEMNIASYQARQQATQEQLSRLHAELDRALQKDPIIRELEALLIIQSKNLKDTQAEIEAGRAKQSNLAEVQRNLSRAKIELAQQQQQLSTSIQGGQIPKYNEDLSRVAIDVAESTAQLGIITKQLEQLNQQIAAANTYEPPTPHIQIATHHLRLAQNRLMQIETKLANMHPPTVTVLGAD
ncbi:MAG: hypothetical protein ACYSSP_09010 [Planctomycetota bacterium]|jgi:hypothetical protein